LHCFKDFASLQAANFAKMPKLPSTESEICFLVDKKHVLIER